MKAVVFAKRSERFPGKHMSLIGGQTLIDRVVSSIRRSALIEDVVIFSRDKSVKSVLCRTANDSTEGSIADSILAALRKYGRIFVFAGDMPCLSNEIINNMVNAAEGGAVVPRHRNGLPEPLHAIYDSADASVLEDNIREGNRKLSDFISRIPHVTYDISSEKEVNFYNVNYVEDLEWIRDNGCVSSNFT